MTRRRPRPRDSRVRASSSAAVLSLLLSTQLQIEHRFVIAWVTANVVYYVLRALQERD